MSKPKLPSTPAEWSEYRCRMSCVVAREALEKSKSPASANAVEYALFNLAHAVEELASLVRLLADERKDSR